MFDKDDIKSWLDGGRIEPASISPVMAQATEDAIRARGKFRADPASLVGKTMEQLLVMVNEIDEKYDVSALSNERDAVRLLTSDWDPRYADRIAPVSDKSHPEALIAHDLQQGKDGEPATRSLPGREMSEEASTALANARSQAQAPAPEEQSAPEERSISEEQKAPEEQSIVSAESTEALTQGGDKVILDFIKENASQVSKLLEKSAPEEQPEHVPSPTVEEATAPKSALEIARAKAAE